MCAASQRSIRKNDVIIKRINKKEITMKRKLCVKDILGKKVKKEVLLSHNNYSQFVTCKKCTKKCEKKRRRKRVLKEVKQTT